MKSVLRYVDLFSGIGGFHLAVRHVASRSSCVFASDIDPACRDVYQRAFRKTVHGDIRLITEPPSGDAARAIRHKVPIHDLLCAGFPCQPFSKSGQQRGIEETRGTLFFDILKVLEVRRPKFVLLENVMNLVGPRHRPTWSTIVSQLRCLGYAASNTPTILSPHLIPREFGGTPQHRLRVYIPAVYVGEQAQALSEPLGPLLPRLPFGSPPTWDISQYLDATLPLAIEQYRVRPEQERALVIWNDLIKRVDEQLPGIPIWGDVLEGLQSVTADNPDWKNAIIQRNEAFRAAHSATIEGWLADNPEFARLKPSFRKLEWQARPGERDIWKHAIQFRPSGIRVKHLTYLPALVAINQASIIGPLGRRISPTEAARLQGFPDRFPFGPDDATTYRQLGNAVAVGVTSLVLRALLDGTVAGKSHSAPPEWQLVRQASDSLDPAASLTRRVA